MIKRLKISDLHMIRPDQPSEVLLDSIKKYGQRKTGDGLITVTPIWNGRKYLVVTGNRKVQALIRTGRKTVRAFIERKLNLDEFIGYQLKTCCC